MADTDKEVLYLEADEEITSAIDKMLAASSESVSIVVPKRSTLLQSIVNQKLLKKAADDAGKTLVLVTADRTSTHLAGRVGLAVAASLKGTATIPSTASPQPGLATEIIEGDEPDAAPEEAATAAAPAAASAAEPVMTRRPISEPPTAPARTDKQGHKVPNFNALQKRFLLIGGGVALLLLLILGNFFLKRATATLYVKGEKVATNFDFKVDTGSTKSDTEEAVVSGQKLELTRELSQKFSATGKKDVGTKATGQMTVYNGYDSSPRSFPAGARFIAPNGLVFRADSDFTVPGAAVVAGSLAPGTTKVSVTADQAGDGYNLAPAKYSIPNQPDQVYGQGNQMGGGTSKQITVVTQSDIDAAKQAALEGDSDAVGDLKQKADKDYRVLDASIAKNVTQATSQPAVDQEAAQATLSLNVSYTALAVPKEDFAKMVEAQQLKQIGQQNQIYDNGIEQATITLKPNKTDQFEFSTDAYGGLKIDRAALAKELTGKRFGDATDIASKQAGVQRAEVNIRPSWSTKLPRITSHIKIEIKVEGVGAR